MNRIYLDYAATTPVDPGVLAEMNKYQSEVFGNASSVHSFGREAARTLDKAREDVARFLNCDFHEVLFTSGATEANNLAIIGLVKKFVLKNPGQKFHVITSAIEHSSVRETFDHIQEMGLAEVTVVGVSEDGLVDPDVVKAAIRPETILVSIMYVNNETGAIQPIRKIGKIIEKFNDREWRATHIEQSAGRTKDQFTAYDKIYFHTDAVQAANYLPLDVKNLHVDLLTISGHKIYGPKGVGALYVKSATPISNLTFGGNQEAGLRSGTFNVPNIAGLAQACNLITPEFREQENMRLKELGDFLVAELQKINGLVINGSLEERTPNNINFSIPGKSGETLLLNLDQRGIAVSTGSACTAAAVEPSHVLTAMNLSADRINGAIRVTLGRHTKIEHLNLFLEVIRQLA